MILNKLANLPTKHPPGLFLSLMILILLIGLAIPLPTPIHATSHVNSHVWSYFSGSPGALFGSAVSSAGDVNGDSYDDILVGAYLFERTEALQAEGRAYLFLGTAAGLEPEPAWTTYGDTAFANYSWAVSTAGDVNGDGFADVAVGATRCNNITQDAGSVRVFYGSASGLSSTPDWVATGASSSTCFGYSLVSAGDVNGDGYSDLLVGARLFDHTFTDEGAVYLYYGSASGLNNSPAHVFYGGQALAELGFAVGSGDFNDDGYSDIVMSATEYSNPQVGEGLVYVYYGSASGPAAVADWVNESNQAGAHYGNSVASAGDVNGDGYSDLLVGADEFDNPLINEGAAFLYLGGAGGLALTPVWTYSGANSGATLGRSVSGAGDINGDGFGDLVLGASAFSAPEVAEGRIFVFYGATGGPALAPDWFHELNQANANLGFAVSTAGDVDNDGYDDFMVGAPGYESSRMSDEGLVKVFHGEPDGLVEPVLNLSLAPNPVYEGSQGILFGSFTVEDHEASFTVTVDWGDGSADSVLVLGTARAFDTSHTYADNAEYLISVTADDGAEITLNDEITAIVTNVPPSLTLTGPANIEEAAVYTLGIGQASDPGDDTLTACQLDWGDGSPLQDCLAALGSNLVHTFADGPANHTIRLHLTDEDGTYQDVDTLDVSVTNLAPVAVDDEYTTPPNHTTVIPAPGVLRNDADVPADTLTASLVSGTSAGTLNFHSDGSFTFTPPSGFVGELSFTYQAIDKDGGVSNTATVTLTVDNLYLYLPVVVHSYTP